MILRVAISTPVRKLFDYLPPLENETPPEIGARILIPFRTKKKIGIIIEITDQTDCPVEKLKRAHIILDTKSLFPKTLLQLIHWASQYYQTSLGDVFEAALPGRLRKTSFLHLKPKKNKKALEKKLLPIPKITPTEEIILNDWQKKSVDAIKHSIGKFETFLLEGVTGSGKTQVYSEIIAHILNLGQQALILVPEIGLTPQLLARFQKQFNVPIACLNSSLTEKQRLEAWESARTGTAPIVIGTRSAAFVPLKTLGVLICDEEHDASFKQQEGFRYHARDLIIMRGALEQCPVILGSATPSMETLNNIHQGRFQHLKLPARAGNAVLPTLQVLDIRHKKLKEGLSAELIQTMQAHLDNKGQVLLFLNRRGFAPILMCFDCGWVSNCKNCDARLTLHARSKKLQCHHCEMSILIYTHCPACQSKNIKPVGVGTERLETTLTTLFPTRSIVRIDRDTTSKKGVKVETLDQIHKGETDILIGTQMIAKGHHFPNVTLVAILDIDHALFSTDFRSLEKMGQLVTQVAGRAGRAERLGHVLLQTCHPEHPVLKTLLNEGYSHFANLLLTERRLTHLPPYSYQALIRAEGHKLEYAVNFLNAIKSEIAKERDSNFKILGPVSAPMERRLGKYRVQLLLQANKRSLLQKCLNYLVPKIEIYPLANKIRWSLDIDPIDMY
jgi:primosomal protein N' (replication factor Y)